LASTAVFIYLVPVFTIIQSVLLLGEQLSWFKLAGAMVIIFGVYLTTRPDSAFRAKKNLIDMEM
jgi:drug/metabolite transporter (DMT)-like permease